MKKIAILGATGYIGRSLAYEISLSDKYGVFLFSRSREKLDDLLKHMNVGANLVAHTYSEFNEYEYDVVVNCAGIGNPSFLKKAPAEIFRVTEELDDLIIRYMEKHPETLYINLSSGAVYGQGTEGAVNASTRTILDINKLAPSDYYAIAKINSEAKHRALPHLNIVDLRIFAFFSRFVDVDANFLMSDIIRCIKSKEVLETMPEDMTRDYVCTKDLLALIESVINKGKINDFFDVYSLAPVSKFEILDFFNKKYSLEHKFKNTPVQVSPTGQKRSYFSEDKKAATLGYVPKYSSLSGIEEEASYI